MSKSLPKITMVQLIKPARFGRQGIPLDNLYAQGLPSDTNVDSGPIAIEWDVDARFLRVVCTKTEITHLLPLVNISMLTVK